MTQVRAGVAVRLTGPDGATLWQVEADVGSGSSDRA